MASVSHSGTRSNNTLTIGVADTQQVPIVLGSVVGITANAFYNATPSIVASVVFDAGESDVRVGLTVVTGAPDILFRAVDTNNLWGFLTVGGVIQFALKKDGVITQLLASTAYTVMPGDLLEVLARGESLSAFVNGVQLLQYTSSVFLDATRHGFELQGSAQARLFTSVSAVAAVFAGMPWESPDLLARCKRHARRPLVDASMTDLNWYAFLTEAQGEVYPDLFSRFPDLQYGAPVLMTTGDGGATYSFGVDTYGRRIRPTGHVEIYPSRASIPEAPLVPGIDFMVEGSVVRMFANRTRTFSDGPYARMVVRADDAFVLASDVNPQLRPRHARILLVWKALAYWAARPGSGADVQYYEARYQGALNGILTELATNYNMQGHSGAGTDQRWWTIMDLGQHGVAR